VNLRDAVCALLTQAREAGGNVVSIAAVEGVLDRYDGEQREQEPEAGRD
jgi:hypothetical protein